MKFGLSFAGVFIIVMILAIDQVVASLLSIYIARIFPALTGEFPVILLQFSLLNLLYAVSVVFLVRIFTTKVYADMAFAKSPLAFFIFLAGASFQVIGSEIENIGSMLLGRNAAMNDIVFQVASLPNASGMILAFLFLAVLPPLFEEIFFRHFIQRGLGRRIGFGKALVVTSLLFALIHVNPTVVLPIFILSLLLGYLYEKHGLGASILLHAAVNSCVVFIVRMEPQIRGLKGDTHLIEHVDFSLLISSLLFFTAALLYFFRQKKSVIHL